VTAEAANAVRQHLADQPELARCYLRLRVVPGGCQGFMHKLDLDPVVSPEDYTFESGGVKVVVLARQIELLRGTTVDFGRSSEGDKVGFKVENPNFMGEACKRSVEVLQEEPVAK
jgi:iron-sulfur cluster assembly protein